MKVVTDSAADLTAEDLNSYDIAVVPLIIQFPEGAIRSEDLTPDGFYNRLEALQPHAPTTTQPSPEIFSKLYRELGETGEEILSIHISSGLSGTLNSARLGAEQSPDSTIHLVDSMTLSGGQRFQILAAACAAREGWSPDEIIALLSRVRAETEVVYTLETLSYLMRGGRIGRVQALASSILDIKPIIHVDKSDGKYSTVGKSRTMRKAIQDLADHLGSSFGSQRPVWVSVVHGRLEERAQQLTELLQAKLNIARLEILRISPVLGVHTGPGIVGATVVPLDAFSPLQIFARQDESPVTLVPDS